MSNLIKNKNRQIKEELKANIKHFSYQPEYERLNIEPIVNRVDPHDFMPVKKIGRKSPHPEILSQQKLPQSGQNEDIIWSQGLSSTNKNSSLQEESRNEILEKEDQEIFGDSTKSVNSRRFLYDEIPDIPTSLVDDLDLNGEEVEEEEEEEEEQQQEEEEQQQEDQQEGGFKLSDLRSGDYILLYNDEVIYVGSLEEIKDNLNKILLNSNNYLVEDFVVLKRLNIRAGIFIE